MPKGRNAGGYFTDKQHQATNAAHLKNPAEGKTNEAFDSQVKTKSASWPQTGDRRTNEATVSVNKKPSGKNKATK